jgi:hypothetical protein
MRAMPKKIRVTIIAGIATILNACGSTNAKSTIDPEVAKLIELTRKTDTTYALYMWNVISTTGKAPVEEWSAEFHLGHLHRVETPNFRVVADCKAMTGSFINVETGESGEGPKVAKSACGIDANQKILKARLLEEKITKFGVAKSIEIINDSERRTYDISDQGILLGATIRNIDVPESLNLVNAAMHVDPALPEQNIFSTASLSRSVVPVKFRQSPDVMDMHP